MQKKCAARKQQSDFSNKQSKIQWKENGILHLLCFQILMEYHTQHFPIQYCHRTKRETSIRVRYFYKYFPFFASFFRKTNLFWPKWPVAKQCEPSPISYFEYTLTRTMILNSPAATALESAGDRLVNYSERRKKSRQLVRKKTKMFLKNDRPTSRHAAAVFHKHSLHWRGKTRIIGLPIRPKL